MIIIACKIKLRIPVAQSLKDKRNIIKSMMHKCKNKFNISIAEVDQNDLWQNSLIAFVSVSNNRVYLDKLLTKVIKFIDDYNDVQIIEYSREWL